MRRRNTLDGDGRVVHCLGELLQRGVAEVALGLRPRDVRQHPQQLVAREVSEEHPLLLVVADGGGVAGRLEQVRFLRGEEEHRAS